MNRFTGWLSIGILCVLSVAVSSSAQAEMTSGPFTTTTPISYTLTDWAKTLSFPKFDSSLGTLVAVDLYVRGDISTVLTVHNSSPTGSTGHANTHLQVSVQDAGDNLLAPQIDILSPSYNYNLAAGQSVTSGTLTKYGTSTDQYTDSAVLAEFTGPGTILLSASTFTETALFNTGGNTDASQVTQAKLTGTVTYHYNATPEPSTLVLFAIGTVSLLAYVWRRR
jgi:hypothetical protein